MPKFTNLRTNVQPGPDYQCAKFRPLLSTCLRDNYLLLNFVDFDGGVTDKDSKRCVSADHAATKEAE